MLDTIPPPDARQTRRVLLASMVGTTIEFYDFYIYATAAVLVFPRLFFPSSDASTASLQSLVTFALAFLARPVGSALFGHFGDRVGRKTTLVTALLTMGISTICIGLLPTYSSLGVYAALLLALCRVGQGIGLGGEWGGAVLLATENAPLGKHGWFGMFPQLGAPLGLFISIAAFLTMSSSLTEAQLFSWGWRIPFLASTVLVVVGLYIRLQLTETPAFKRALETGQRVAVPMFSVVTKQPLALLLGTLGATTTFVVFYLANVFALGYATNTLGFGRRPFLVMQLIGVVFFGAVIPFTGRIADRIGGRNMMIIATLATLAFGFAFQPLFGANDSAKVLAFLILGFGLSGLSYGPLGGALASMFPTPVRYTGTSLTFNLPLHKEKPSTNCTLAQVWKNNKTPRKEEPLGHIASQGELSHKLHTCTRVIEQHLKMTMALDTLIHKEDSQHLLHTCTRVGESWILNERMAPGHTHSQGRLSTLVAHLYKSRRELDPQ